MELRNAYQEFATVLEAINETTIVHVYGDIDIARAPEFEAAVAQAGEADLPILIDLRDCKFLDSSGLTVLVRALKRYGKRVQVVVTEGSAVARTLAVTALGDIMTIRVISREKRGK